MAERTEGFHLNQILKYKYQFLPLMSLFVMIYCFLLSDPNWMIQIIAALFLGIAISMSVHFAEELAHKMGPSLGMLLLALAVTIIEVALILNIMSQGGHASSTVARDTVFASIMIVTNGIVGVCILLGGLKYKQLSFQTQGTGSLLSVLVTLAALTMVLPNYTISTEGPTYSVYQLMFVSVAAVLIYAATVWAQTRSHQDLFSDEQNQSESEFSHRPLFSAEMFPHLVLNLVMLVISLMTVVGIAKFLSPAISTLVSSAGAPPSTVGILIALLVLAPETLAALNAAKHNRLQTSLNLALGSGAASIALTIPVVSLYSVLTGHPLVLGLDGKSMAFLMLTFLAGNFTFGSRKTFPLNGLVHLVILVSYLALSVMP